MDIFEDLYKEQDLQKSIVGEGYHHVVDDIIQKGKAAQIGEIRTWGGVKYRKDTNGWFPVKEGSKGKKEEEVNKKGKLSPDELKKQKESYPVAKLSQFAKETSESNLNTAIKNSSDPKIREAAHKELDRRNKEEHVNEKKEGKEEKKGSKDKADKVGVKDKLEDEEEITANDWEDWAYDHLGIDDKLKEKLNYQANNNVVPFNSTLRGESFKDLEELKKKYKPRRKIKLDNLTSTVLNTGDDLSIAKTYSDNSLDLFNGGKGIKAIIRFENPNGIIGLITDPFKENATGGELLLPENYEYSVNKIDKIGDYYLVNLYSNDKHDKIKHSGNIDYSKNTNKEIRDELGK